MPRFGECSVCLRLHDVRGQNFALGGLRGGWEKTARFCDKPGKIVSNEIREARQRGKKLDNGDTSNWPRSTLDRSLKSFVPSWGEK